MARLCALSGHEYELQQIGVKCLTIAFSHHTHTCRDNLNHEQRRTMKMMLQQQVFQKEENL